MMHLHYIKKVCSKITNLKYRAKAFGFFNFRLIFCLSNFIFFNVHSIQNTQYKSWHKNDEVFFTPKIDEQFLDTNSGLVFIDARTGKVIYEHNGDQYFTPASVIKLFTAIVALDDLKPNFRYSTVLQVDQKTQVANTIFGNVYFKFSGDPSLKDQNLSGLVDKMSALGIQKIHGDVILDSSNFDDMYYPQGIVYEDTQWSYGAPVSSIIINNNSIPIHIGPTQAVGEKPKLTINNFSRYFPILSNNVKAVTFNQAMHECAFLVELSQINEIQAKGCWPINSKVSIKKVGLKNPEYFARQLIKNILKKNNIQVTGAIKSGYTPNKTKTIASHQSQTLEKLLIRMLNFSDSLYTNALLKAIGAKHNKQGTFFNGIDEIKKQLSSFASIDTQQMRIFDGAGLSIYNLVTPNQVSKLLYFAYHRPEIRIPLIKALAKPGKHGTLTSRMSLLKPRVHVAAKTGTMKGVTTLAGYLTTEFGQDIIFTLMTDHNTNSQKDIRQLQDDIIYFVSQLKLK